MNACPYKIVPRKFSAIVRICPRCKNVFSNKKIGAMFCSARCQNTHYVYRWRKNNKFTKQMLEEGYLFPRKLPTGKWVGCFQMNFTGGLFVGLNESGYEKRYCYTTIYGAMAAALTWDGEGDPPGNWIKEKGDGIDRINPNIEDNIYDRLEKKVRT